MTFCSSVIDFNWYDQLADILSDAGLALHPSLLKLATSITSHFDIVAHLSSAAAGSDKSNELGQALSKCDWVEAVNCRQHSIGVRFSRQFVETLRDIVNHSNSAAWYRKRETGRHVIVNFVDPNTCKPLHVGHLRNIVLGNSIARLQETAGAVVSRQSLLGDIGRSVCEALAGALARKHVNSCQPAGMKTDHYFGICYAEYVRGLNISNDDGAGPIARELTRYEDSADGILQKWFAGDLTITTEWQRMRDAVLAGHAETLSRLGIVIDRKLFESDVVGHARALAMKGIEQSILEHGEHGAIIYRSGRKELPVLVVVRPDGFPTEFGRTLSLLSNMQALSGLIDKYIAVIGDEWQVPAALYEEILRQMQACPLYDDTRLIVHGMVTVGGSKMKSSDGNAVLIDHLLDELRAHNRIQMLVAVTEGRVNSETIARLLLSYFFLAAPVRKPIKLSIEQLLSDADSSGWLLGRVWCKALGDIHSSAAPQNPDCPEFRRLILRSLDFGLQLDRAVASMSASPMLWLARSLAEGYMSAGRSREFGLLTLRLLGNALQAIGILDQNAPVVPGTRR
jgi:arginyl-tRNA synthetase